jgi:hypothetical protein
MTSATFDPNDQENWHGGYYEAAIVLGPSTSPDADNKLRTAIAALWAHPSLTITAFSEISQWDWRGRALDAHASLDDLQRIYGVFQHDTLGVLPFTSVVVREEDGDDWLDACIPLGGLEQSGGYPFGDDDELAASRNWREPLEQALADLALRVASVVGLQIAAIGFEVAGIINADNASPDAKRYVGYVARHGNSFQYLPTNAWGSK